MTFDIFIALIMACAFSFYLGWVVCNGVWLSRVETLVTHTERTMEDITIPMERRVGMHDVAERIKAVLEVDGFLSIRREVSR